jgi:glycogen synthase
MHKNWLESNLFSYDEAYKLRNSENFKVKTVIYCSYENRFAKAGGLGSVASVIVPYLDSFQKSTKAILITPYHKNAMKEEDKKKLSYVGHFPIYFYEAFGMEEHVEIFSYTHEYGNASYKEYYLLSEHFFNDPVYGWNLNNDAMFFSKCIPRAAGFLESIKEINDGMVFHLNDWHTALASLAIKESILVDNLKHARSILTLHNLFDENPTENIWRISKRNYTLLKALTPLQIGLELCSGPPTTVSENYAKEMFYDPMEREVYGRRIKNIISDKGIIGINNGLFCPVNEIYADYKNLSLEEIKRIKQKERADLIAELDKEYLNKEGHLKFRKSDASPIFFMYGRYDTVQKGFDFITRAFKLLLEKLGHGKVKLILTPITDDHDEMKRLHSLCPYDNGDFAIYKGIIPFFDKILSGSTYGVFPSVYEPFGGALEMICNGTPVIGRSTGGLVDQLPHKFRFREPVLHYNEENLYYHMDTKDNILERHNLWSDDVVWALYNKMYDFYMNYKDHRNNYYREIRECPAYYRKIQMGRLRL